MIRVCSLAELPPGESVRLDLKPPISVFHTDDGELFAVDDTCTHEQASLAEGWLEGCEVECPLHAARFNLRTGEPDGLMTSIPVRTHQVSISDGDIYLTVSSGTFSSGTVSSGTVSSDAPDSSLSTGQ